MQEQNQVRRKVFAQEEGRASKRSKYRWRSTIDKLEARFCKDVVVGDNVIFRLSPCSQ